MLDEWTTDVHFEFENVVGIFWPFYGLEEYLKSGKMCCDHPPLSILLILHVSHVCQIENIRHSYKASNPYVLSGNLFYL